MKLISHIKKAFQARKNRRKAVRMLIYSGVLRHAGMGIRYGVSESGVRSMIAEDES